MITDVDEQLGYLRDLQVKQQQEMSSKRTLIDSLSAQLSGLARHQKECKEAQACVEESIRKLAEVLTQFKTH